MTTINDIINNYNSRDAQAILSDIIKANTDDTGWDRIVEACRSSDIVNTEHPHSKRMAKFAPSQVLRNMTTRGMGIWVHLIATEDDNIRAWEHVAIAFAGEHPADVALPAWPWNLEQDGLFATDISELIELFLEDESAEEVYAREAVDEAYRDILENIEYDSNTIDIANMATAKATGGAISDIRTVVSEVATLRRDLEAAKAAAAQAKPQAQPIVSDGTIPAGYPVTKNAQDVFGMRNKLLDFDVTTWQWESANPFVPTIDNNYQFDVEALSVLLFGLENNLRSWVAGPTGSGKSTLVAQACAVMGKMCRRINLSKESSTYQLIGKVDAKEGGTYFKDGIIPQTMQQPAVLLLDEADAAMGDINMALQPVLEGNALTIGEDGARVVHPHDEFRIVATANTYGSGDPTGLYSSGVKMQSRASMNRYNLFINVDYMDPAEEMKLVRKIVPNMSKAVDKMLAQFLRDYRKSYKSDAVTTPLSPRNTITMGRMATFYEGLLNDPKEAVERAITTNVILSADEADSVAIKGIADKAIA